MGEPPPDPLGGDHSAGPWQRKELLVKEALQILMIPSEERFNQDGRLEVPGCWTTVMRRQGGREEQSLLTFDLSSVVHGYK